MWFSPCKYLKKLRKPLIFIFVVFAVSACGGGGGSSGGSGGGNAGGNDSGGDTDATVPPPLDTVSLSGTISFDSVPHINSSSGLNYNLMTSKPARGVVVELLDSSNTVLSATTTDANGHYSFSIAMDINVQIRVSALLMASGSPSWDVRVLDNTRADSLYVMQGALASTAKADSVRDLHASSGWTGADYTQTRTAAPFAILDSVYQSMQLVISADAGVSLPPLKIHWSKNNTAAEGDLAEGDISTSFYSDGKIYILGAADNDSDEYDSHVIAHEWCHFFEDKLSRSDSFGGEHGLADYLDMRLSFSEGFCNGFSAMAMNDSVYRDSSGQQQASGFDFDLENNDFNVSGWYSEGTIGSMVYDIYDSNDDGVDIISDGFDSLYTVMTSSSYVTTDAVVSIYLLLSELKTQFPSTVTAVDSLAGFHDITVNDELGSGETNDAGNTSFLPVYNSLTVGGPAVTVCSINDFGLFNKLGNSPLVIFTTASTREYTVIVTRLSEVANTDPDFMIWRKGDSVAISESETVNSETWVGTLTPDTYVMDVYEARNIFDNIGIDVCFNVTVN